MRNKLEALQREGLVIEGQYPDFKDVKWTQNGESHRLEVRPLVLRRADMTVLRPMQRGNTYDVSKL